MKKIIAVVCCLLVLGCTSNPLRDFGVRDYKDEPKVELKVSIVKIKPSVQYAMEAPYIEYQMPVTPVEALIEWGKNRFLSVSPTSPVEAYLTIDKASMKATDKPSENWYTFDNTEYELSYKITMTFMTGDKVVSQRVVQGWEKESLPMKSSIEDKEKAWEGMMNRMVEKVDGKIVDYIPTYFTK